MYRQALHREANEGEQCWREEENGPSPPNRGSSVSPEHMCSSLETVKVLVTFLIQSIKIFPKISIGDNIQKTAFIPKEGKHLPGIPRNPASMQSHVSAMVPWKVQQHNTFEIYKEECLPQIRHKKATKP